MKSIIKFNPVCTLIIISMTLSLFAGDEWIFERVSDGVTVYSKIVPGLLLKEFRGECIVPVPLERIKAVMMDYENYQRWFAMTRRITLLRKSSPTNFTMNYVVASPWPMDDRETDVQVSINFQEKTGKGVVILDAIKSRDNTGKNGLVRINDMRSRFEFTRLGNDSTKAVLYMKVDPRIDLPAKLQNGVLENYPFDTFRGLRKMVSLH